MEEMTQMMMTGILIEELLVILEGALEEMIHLEGVFPFQEETHNQVTIPVMDMVIGDTQDVYLLGFPGDPSGTQGLGGDPSGRYPIHIS